MFLLVKNCFHYLFYFLLEFTLFWVVFGRVGLCLSFVGCVWLSWVALCCVRLCSIIFACFALFDLVFLCQICCCFMLF